MCVKIIMSDMVSFIQGKEQKKHIYENINLRFYLKKNGILLSSEFIFYMQKTILQIFAKIIDYDL